MSFQYFCVASCNNNAIFVWFSLICFERLGFLEWNLLQLIKTGILCLKREKKRLYNISGSTKKRVLRDRLFYCVFITNNINLSYSCIKMTLIIPCHYRQASVTKASNYGCNYRCIKSSIWEQISDSTNYIYNKCF